MAKPQKVAEKAHIVAGFDGLIKMADKQQDADPRPPEIGGENERPILTAGEQRVLLWCGNGKTSFEISRILGLSEHTVNHYIASAVRKLDATNRTHAIAKALKLKIVDIADIN